MRCAVQFVHPQAEAEQQNTRKARTDTSLGPGNASRQKNTARARTHPDARRRESLDSLPPPGAGARLPVVLSSSSSHHAPDRSAPPNNTDAHARAQGINHAHAHAPPPFPKSLLTSRSRPPFLSLLPSQTSPRRWISASPTRPPARPRVGRGMGLLGRRTLLRLLALASAAVAVAVTVEAYEGDADPLYRCEIPPPCLLRCLPSHAGLVSQPRFRSAPTGGLSLLSLIQSLVIFAIATRRTLDGSPLSLMKLGGLRSSVYVRRRTFGVTPF